MTTTHRSPAGRPPAIVAAAITALGLAGCASPPEPVTTTVPVTPTAAASVATAPLTASPDSGFTALPLPPGRPGIPRGGLPPVATRASRNPDVVAAAGLSVYYGADTAIDLTPSDATRRALPWTAGPLAAAIRGYRLVAAPGALWNSWATHRAYLTVRVRRAYDGGAPPDTARTVYRQYDLALTPDGANHRAGPTAAFTDFLTLTDTTTGWRITTLEQS